MVVMVLFEVDVEPEDPGRGDDDWEREARRVITGFLSLPVIRTFEPTKRPTTPSQWPYYTSSVPKVFIKFA